ncbi:MAG: hypothetical protein F6K10_17905 [Moorea sp. SIO2B7]|nr:hypothetical protein [Moorena sp. SIO2B7]
MAQKFKRTVSLYISKIFFQPFLGFQQLSGTIEPTLRNLHKTPQKLEFGVRSYGFFDETIRDTDFQLL